MKDIRNVKIPGKIDSIYLYVIDVPFRKPFSTSSYTWSSKKALLVQIMTDGVSGWGECVADPDPFYSPETITSAQYIIKEYILPFIKPGMSIAEFTVLLNKIRGNRMARAAVENALLDLCARLQEKPLYAFLGLTGRPVPSGISIGIQSSIEGVLQEMYDAVRHKYHRVKLKIKRGHDAKVLHAVRNIYPDLPLMADANGDYTLADLPELKKLDEYNLMMIEQPLGYDDILDHAELQKQITTPVCLDESIHSLDDTRHAIEQGSCKIINIKQGRVGGMMEALGIAEYCSQKGIPVWCGGMDETGIGRAFNLHLQLHPGFTLPGDTSPTLHYFAEDFTEPTAAPDSEGFFHLTDAHGTGMVINQKVFEKFVISGERVL